MINKQYKAGFVLHKYPCNFEALTEELEHIDQILEGFSVLALARDFALQGLLNRMPQGPGELAAKMNKLGQEMTLSNRRANSCKLLKKVLRKMKTLLRRIGQHDQTHRSLLASRQK